MASKNNETVHISLGNTANHITSHLLNLQGLAVTSPPQNNNDYGWGNEGATAALCDPSVTHDVASLNSDYYSSHSTRGAAASRYVHVPRCLIVDGRDSFGTSWGGVSRSGGDAARPRHQGLAQQNPSNLQVPSWNGAVSIFDPSEHSIVEDLPGHSERRPPLQSPHQRNDETDNEEEDPLDRFHDAASVMGLSPVYSRFNAAPPTTYSSYNYGAGGSDSSRHVQWDDDEEEEEEDCCYGQNIERIQEEKRRRLEKMEYHNREARRGYVASMEDAWEEAFYGGRGADNGSQQDATTGETSMSNNSNKVNDATNGTTTNNALNAINNSRVVPQREIQWHNYWMPPKPSPSKYQVPLPFDTHGNACSNNSSVWSTSFNMGYSPESGGDTASGIGGGDSAGITRSWREHVLSESLRRVLEGCDVVKGFNVFVDGGGSFGVVGGNGNIRVPNIVAGGGFHAGLAASLMEELSEECRSAGRWAVMADPLSPIKDICDDTEAHHQNQQNNFRRRLNAGLALHGLSANADVFLPLSVDGAYRALRGGDQSSPKTSKHALFEGSAAISLALEASTLFYRLQRPSASIPSSSGGCARSRIGIQSGFYQGYSTGPNDNGNEPYATAPSLTYHEFLACACPSSDRRRSVLELDALLRPISYPPAGGVGSGVGAFAGAGGALSPSLLASLASSGIVGRGINNSTMGELEKRMMRGTSIERIKMEQQRQQYRSSRRGNAYSLKQDQEPGGWLEDTSTVREGLLTSLSGNFNPFGRRADHHHFALSTSLRPAASDVRGSSLASTTILRPMMESMGVKYRPEVSLGLAVKDTVVDLTAGVGSYWRSIFTDRRSSDAGTQSAQLAAAEVSQRDGGNSFPKQQPLNLASHMPILSVLGNSTRSYPRLRSVSSGFVDTLLSRRNIGYLSRDVMARVIPEKDDCTEALEYCQELTDVYDPPTGSGLAVMAGEDDENDDLDAYFDEN